MRVRFRITLLFTLLVVLIWGIVCAAVYYISYSSRITTIKTRLVNRAITTTKLISLSEIFDQEMISRIDSSTTLALKRKSVQVYNNEGRSLYHYSELPGDTIVLNATILNRILEKGTVFFTQNGKEVVGYYNSSGHNSPLILSAAFDEDGYAALNKLGKIILLCFITGALLTFAGGYIFTKRLLKPVRHIANDVKDISAYSLERRIKETGGQDEWSFLVRTLNELLDRLKDSFEMQRRFISNASHELSTPLTSISSQLEVSLQRQRSEADYRHVMQNVLQDTRHMNNLVQTLLRFATASGNAGGLDIELVRIDEILMRLAGAIDEQQNEERVILDFDELPEDQHELLILGNEELLFTAIRNIVANACKYSPDHEARVSLKLTAAGFIIGVADKGIGIAQEELKYIFQPFYRVGESPAVSGFGLGLSLALQIIRLHKGDVRVESAVGQGSVFYITLPPVG
jgi:two-component system, OmpR family, sensor histidine kinase ArlS